MKLYLHKTTEGLLLNQNLRSIKSGVIFCSEGAVNLYIKALSNTEDTEVKLVKTYN